MSDKIEILTEWREQVASSVAFLLIREDLHEGFMLALHARDAGCPIAKLVAEKICGAQDAER